MEKLGAIYQNLKFGDHGILKFQVFYEYLQKPPIQAKNFFSFSLSRFGFLIEF